MHVEHDFAQTSLYDMKHLSSVLVGANNVAGME